MIDVGVRRPRPTQDSKSFVIILYQYKDRVMADIEIGKDNSGIANSGDNNTITQNTTTQNHSGGGDNVLGDKVINISNGEGG